MLIKVPFKGAFLMSNFQPAASDATVVTPTTDLFNRAGGMIFKMFFLAVKLDFCRFVNSCFEFDTALLLIKEYHLLGT